MVTNYYYIIYHFLNNRQNISNLEILLCCALCDRRIEEIGEFSLEKQGRLFARGSDQTATLSAINIRNTSREWSNTREDNGGVLIFKSSSLVRRFEREREKENERAYRSRKIRARYLEPVKLPRFAAM